MGANQSEFAEGDGPAPAVKKQCYYELLGVERTASEVEIKAAYKKQALKLHPDRNYGNVEEATAKFTLVQEAYETLSDANDRAWYDAHRDQILNGKKPTEVDGPDGVGSTVDQLLRFFDPSIFSVVDDSAGGLFTIARKIFAQLELEESEAADELGAEYAPLPSFGGSTSGPDDVRRFYVAWGRFATLREFAWADKYRLSDAPDRRVRRAMEKENKKLRDAARKEYNDTVKAFVNFIGKRDPRERAAGVTDAQRQQELRAAAKSQSAKARAARKEQMAAYETPDWMDTQEDDRGYHVAAAGDDDDYDDDVDEVYECVVCDKIFKNENQFDSHEKSKKHLKAVRDLTRQMRREGIEFGLDTAPLHGGAEAEAEAEPEPAPAPEADLSDAGDASDASEIYVQRTSRFAGVMSDAGDDDDSADDGAVDALADDLAAASVSADPADAAASAGAAPAPKKLGKAKERRAKKEQKAQDIGDILICATCEQMFPSRNKLFDHVKSLGHAAPPPAQAAAPKKKKKGKKK
ncbi:uncharacterized protein V1510DRAFT_364996 [Dipodascopsis tothii]|uniref:uncharacterized protein n=1 Tax=Dipodascopsis tothii TaxID=44089 RepID=UPI0034CDC3E5